MSNKIQAGGTSIKRARVFIYSSSLAVAVIYSGIKMPMRDTVEVELQSPVKGNARAYIHACPARVSREASLRVAVVASGAIVLSAKKSKGLARAGPRFISTGHTPSRA